MWCLQLLRKKNKYRMVQGFCNGRLIIYFTTRTEVLSVLCSVNRLCLWHERAFWGDFKVGYTSEYDLPHPPCLFTDDQFYSDYEGLGSIDRYWKVATGWKDWERKKNCMSNVSLSASSVFYNLDYMIEFIINLVKTATAPNESDNWQNTVKACPLTVDNESLIQIQPSAFLFPHFYLNTIISFDYVKPTPFCYPASLLYGPYVSWMVTRSFLTLT